MDLFAIPGQTIPLWWTAESRDPGLFPLARVYDQTTTLVSAIPLVHQSGGIYAATFVVPTAQKYLVDYTAYLDLAHSIPDSLSAAAQDSITADLPATSPSAMAAAVWDAQAASHVATGSFGWLMRIVASIAGRQFFRLDQVSYNTDGFATLVRFRVFPDSATASASTQGGTGEGELATITLSGSPDLTFPQLPVTVVGT